MLHIVNSIRTGRPAPLLSAAILLVLLVVVFSFTLPPAVDWHDMYRPAAIALASGRSPFEIDRFSNAPWALIPMLPFVLVPEPVGRAALAVIALITLAWISRRFGASPLTTVFFLLSPPVIQSMLDGNIDWMASLGFVLPPQIGLFFLAIKPQTGIAVAFFYLVEAWRKNGLREVVRVFAPVSIALLLSFLLYGFWPVHFNNAFGWGGNTSLWPMSIPVGLALLVAALRRRKIEFAMAASPCLSPYVLLHSWLGPFFAIASSTPETIIAVIGLWIVVGMRALGY
jgi:hypothetical protein